MTLSLPLTLALAVVSLVVWVLLTFVHPVGGGMVHLLLAVSVVLLVRWIALRDQ
jgi:hypothetical protein